MAKNSNGKDFIIGSLIGGLVGAATALFLAPKSGKEMRNNLGQQASMMKERTGIITNGALEKGSEFAAVAKDKTLSLSQVVTEQSSQIMDKVRSITNTSNSEEQADVVEKEITDALEELTDETVGEEKKQNQPEAPLLSEGEDSSKEQDAENQLKTNS
ncbi:MAG TPA: YtxH domain-containing protein [Metabacillus sp.]|nr:YtxH domain-containing protein [Metabacillus sp.]